MGNNAQDTRRGEDDSFDVQKYVPSGDHNKNEQENYQENPHECTQVEIVFPTYCYFVVVEERFKNGDDAIGRYNHHHNERH